MNNATGNPVEKSRNKRLVITLVLEQLLLDVAEYRYLSNEQLCRRRYSHGMLTTVRARTHLLERSRYLQRLFLERRAPYGSAKSVFTLGAKGRAYLQRQGRELPRYHHTEQQERAPQNLQHDSEVNDTLIALALLCETHPGFALDRVVHEHELRRDPDIVAVTGPNGATMSLPVIPDAWVSLLNAGDQLAFALELDRGTGKQPSRWHLKVRKLLAWFQQGIYQRRFDTHSLTIAILTTSGEKRRDRLLTWTEEELDHAGARELAEMFLFAACQPDALSPADLFLAPRWFVPGRSAPIPLLEDLSE